MIGGGSFQRSQNTTFDLISCFKREGAVAARVPFSEHKSGDDTTGSIKSRLWADVGV